MDSNQTLKDLATEVQEMRNLQKEYFKTRDKLVLAQSKSKERHVDKMVFNILQLTKEQ